MRGPSERAWHRLDNAAKIFPPNSGKSDPKVFRFSCELTEPVDGALLQTALERTAEDFPVFRYILKRGLFWYYLEHSNLSPQARPEDAPPCSTAYVDSKSLLYSVTWYRRRINLEVYHALTDGTGALEFLKALTVNYLKLAKPEAMQAVTGPDYDASEAQKLSDSYSKFYDKGQGRGKEKRVPAHQIKGAKEAEGRLKIIEGTVSARAVLAKARDYGATATALVAAVLIRAIYADMSVRERAKPIVITIPINLRNFFESKSAMNFFSIAEIRFDPRKDSDALDDLVKAVKEQLSGQLNVDYLQNRLNKLYVLQQNLLIRLVPLPVKNIVMNIAYSRSAKERTAAVSNLGKITMPEEAKPFIRLFDVFTSTPKLQICMCSFEDCMNISFTSPFVSTDIQRGFFRQLGQMGIQAEINANKLRSEGV